MRAFLLPETSSTYSREADWDVYVFCIVHSVWCVLHSKLVYRSNHRQLQHAKEKDEY